MRRTVTLALLVLSAVIMLSPAAKAQGRIITETLKSQALRGNLIGDTANRELTIYLPPSYDRKPKTRFPVLYLLHGYTSQPSEWLDGSYQGMDLRKSMDAMADAGGSEYIVVMPMADNSYGGSFYVNSAAFGRWEEFIAKELVRYVDGRFRTLRAARSRGLAGQSMGGFGALFLAGRHPETFGHIYAVSPACLGFVGELAPNSDAWKSAAPDTAPVSGQSKRIRTMAAAFAPSGKGSRSVGTPMPFAVDSGGRLVEVEQVLRSWRAYLPLERLTRDAHPYRRLLSIAMDFGREDQIPSVPAGTRAFAEVLKQAGIPFTLEEYTGGHIDKTRERFEKHVLPFFSRAFSAGHGR